MAALNMCGKSMQWLGTFVTAPSNAKNGDAYHNTTDNKSYVMDNNKWSVLAEVSVGPQGPQGPKGNQGTQGLTGATGLQGPIGLTGAPGPAGATGAMGSIGPTGLPGPQGVQGPKGDKGDQGIQGLTGATGPQGAQGDKGDKGDIGLQGIQGLAGATGPQGPTGDIGPQGSQGIAGPTGPQGLKGDPGSGTAGNNPGDMQYWDGTQWVVIPVGTPGQILTLSASHVPIWWTYAGSIPIKDADGNIYHAVTIGTQTWMVENLKTTKYNDGTPIPLVTDNIAWGRLTTPGYCWYNNDSATYSNPYGALYNWYAVTTGKLAPPGWHVPTVAEWDTLITFLGGVMVAGSALKSTGTTYWHPPNSGATNSSGFSALPGGRLTGTFSSIGTYGDWWAFPGSRGLIIEMNNNDQFLNLNDYPGNGGGNGCSVRCVRDN
jgi:uncharacterized protein (TIGR02145 family)